VGKIAFRGVGGRLISQLLIAFFIFAMPFSACAYWIKSEIVWGKWKQKADGQLSIPFTVVRLTSDNDTRFPLLCDYACRLLIVPYSGNGGSPMTIDYVSSKTLLTLAQVVARINAELLPWSGEVIVRNDSFPDERCFLATIVSTRGDTASESSCAQNMPPPPPVFIQCAMDKDIVLQHGVLEVEKVNGNIATATAALSCSGRAQVRVTARGTQGDAIVLDKQSGLSSQLKVNGYSGGSGVTLTFNAKGSQSITFTSTLQSRTPAAGNFLGSGVVVVDIL
jgi:hypothetical protein